MSLIKNQNGLVIQADSFDIIRQSNFQKETNPDNTTRIYSTINGHQMKASEAKQCVKMYEAEYLRLPLTMYISTWLEPFKDEIAGECGMKVVVVENKMKNSISLTQQMPGEELKSPILLS